jgi:hypothetical protein
MKARANPHPYRTLCTAVVCLLTLSLEQTAISQAVQLDQSPSSQEKCPTVSVSCPSCYDHAIPVTFTALLYGDVADTIRYDWALSAGTILEGQGTATIKVDTSDVDEQVITAEVRVHGLPTGCGTQASYSLMMRGDPPPIATLFDRYYPESIRAAVPKKTHRRRRTPRLH